MSKKNVIIKGEEEGAQSLKNFVLSHLDKFFVDHIPIASFAEMQPECKAILVIKFKINFIYNKHF